MNGAQGEDPGDGSQTRASLGLNCCRKSGGAAGSCWPCVSEPPGGPGREGPGRGGGTLASPVSKCSSLDEAPDSPGRVNVGGSDTQMRRWVGTLLGSPGFSVTLKLDTASF